MVKVRAIILEDGKLIKCGKMWIYVGCDIRIGSTAREALAKAYEVDADDVEVKIRKFRNGTIKALICIEGECNLYDVCEGVGEGGECG